ncbi:MAG TPA: hypothetical protein VG435_18425 [Acidimicrobiales bacterium]|jgi:hypothetical protein|nr:hypothetical protein [Acidimicrobiales bacterium]
MAWGDTVADWKILLEELGMTEFFRDTAIPTTIEDLLKDGNWEVLLHAYAQKEFSAENVEFLRAVATFEASGDLNQAAEIYGQYVSADAAQQVNLPASMRKDLEEIFGPDKEGIGPPSVFDSAKGEIIALLRRDTFVRFRAAAVAAQQKMMKEYVDANSVTDDETDWDNIGGRDRADAAGGLTLEDIDEGAVATVNATEMKALSVDGTVAFVQVGQIVLLGKNHDPQYYGVLGGQPTPQNGTLKMVSKGGAFGAGKVQVSGTTDTANFEAAIRQASQKKIDFTFA